MTCPHCTAVLPDDDLFCEECGEKLSNGPDPADAGAIATQAPCVCGAADSELDEDGYCLQCGRRCRPAPGDHEEKELSPDFAAVSDRGRNHSRNEDRFQVAINCDRYLMIVCDGVSNSTNAGEAAATASECIARALMAGASLDSAIKEARDSVARLADKSSKDGAPSTTVVAAVMENQQTHIAWMGDSRAYWISKDNSQQLTADHSWLNEVVSSNELSYATATKSPHAHGITRWIGADAGSDIEPDITTFQTPGPGLLVLATDGLWNYAPQLHEFAALLQDFPSAATALEMARHLIDYANEKGGADNITVALLRIPD